MIENEYIFLDIHEKNKIQNNFVTKCCQDKGTFVKIREFVKIKEFDVCSQDFQKSCQDKGHSVKIRGLSR